MIVGGIDDVQFTANVVRFCSRTATKRLVVYAAVRCCSTSDAVPGVAILVDAQLQTTAGRYNVLDFVRTVFDK